MRVERLDDRSVVNDALAREVEHDRPGAQLREAPRVEQSPRRAAQRHVQRDEVAGAQDLVDRMGLAHLGGQAPRGVDRDLRVVPEYVHAKTDRRIGDEAADLAQADDAEGVPRELDAGEVLLLVLDPLRQRSVVAAQGGHELHRRNEVARRDQHAGEDELLDCVRVRARRVEHRDPAAAHRRHRDVVGARARPPDRLHRVGDRHRVHVGRPHQDRVGLPRVLRDRVALGREALQADRRDLVEDQDLVTLSHGAPRTRACTRRAAAPLPAASRCRSRRACRRQNGAPSAAPSRVPRRPSGTPRRAPCRAG